MFAYSDAFYKMTEENGMMGFSEHYQDKDTRYYVFGNVGAFTSVFAISIQIKDEKVLYKVWVKGKPWTGLSGNSKGTEIIHIADPVKHQQVINKIAELLKEAATAE